MKQAVKEFLWLSPFKYLGLMFKLLNTMKRIICVSMTGSVKDDCKKVSIAKHENVRMMRKEKNNL